MRQKWEDMGMLACVCNARVRDHKYDICDIS